ncbi:MAG: hypothetical protein ABFS16_08670 [Bacteroidota bacterium]
MKKIILIGLFITTVLISNAQYRTYKNNYELKGYTWQPTDKYKSGTAAAFAIVPGVGHIYIDQPLRGLIFPAGMAVSVYLMVYGSLDSWADSMSGRSSSSGEIVSYLGLISFVGFYAWNFFDVVRVSKIKNMHFRETGMAMRIEPFTEGYLYSNIAGVRLKINF